MINVVVDTNVLVSSFKSAGKPPFTIVELIKNRKIILFYSDPILYEYRDVLKRKNLNLDPFLATYLIHYIARYGVLVEDEVSDQKTTDEDDQIILNAAAEAAFKYGHVYLITGNIKHFPKAPFIVTPAQFLVVYYRTVLTSEG